MTGPVRQLLLVLWGAAALMLVLVCANLSGLLLARTGERTHEVALRLALGARRGRVLRQLLTESVLLALVGAVFGVVLAMGLTSAVRTAATLGLPLLGEVRVDATALVFTTAVAIVTGVLVGLLPALRVSRHAPRAALAEQSRGGTGGQTRTRSRAVLVIAEVALACVLMVGATLLLRSLGRLLDVELGFTPSSAVAMRVETPEATTAGDRAVLFDELTRRVSDMAGVEAAGLTDALPLGRNRGWDVGPVGQTARESDFAFVYVIGPDYLEAMGIPILGGRAITNLHRNVDEPLVVVNETLARSYWPGQDAVGRLLMVNGESRRVIGVTADVQQESLETRPGNQIYLPYWQLNPAPSVDLIVRSTLPDEVLATGLRAGAAQIGGGLLLTDLRPVSTLVESVVGPRRFLVTLLAGFAGLALALACLGVYGVAAQSVNARVREFGIRMALGAPRAGVLRSVMAGTGALALTGLLVGLAGSAAGARYLNDLLFDLDALDPATFVVVATAVTAVAALAAYLPARRATRIDPLDALRDQ